MMPLTKVLKCNFLSHDATDQINVMLKSNFLSHDCQSVFFRVTLSNVEKSVAFSVSSIKSLQNKQIYIVSEQMAKWLYIMCSVERFEAM